MNRRAFSRTLRHSPGSRKPAITTFRSSLDLGKEVDQLLLRKFAPSGVLLNSAMDILEFRGKISSVIEPEAGDASLNIFKMLQPELVAPLRVALHEAQVSTKPVVKRGLVLEAGNRARKIDLEVMRISPEGRGAYYLVLFEEPNAARVKPTMLPTETSKARQRGGNDKLKKELKSTQDHLKFILTRSNGRRQPSEKQSKN